MASRGWHNVTLADIGMRAFPKHGGKAAGVPQERRSKYRAIRTEVHGVTFASKAEGARYQELLLSGAMGLIRNLELQPRFPLVVNGCGVGAYIADFRYEEREVVLVTEGPAGYYRWRDVIEDVKGMKTPVYRLKKKLVEAQYGIQIREVK